MQFARQNDRTFVSPYRVTCSLLTIVSGGLVCQASISRSYILCQASISRSSVLCQASISRSSLLCQASISRSSVLCQASISRSYVLCQASISRSSILCQASISRRSVLCQASISRKSVLCQASISRMPVMCQASVSKVGRQTDMAISYYKTKQLHFNPITNIPRPRSSASKLDVNSSTFGRFVPFCNILSTVTVNIRRVRGKVETKAYSAVQCNTSTQNTALCIVTQVHSAVQSNTSTQRCSM
jgi:hypothetical protein